MAVVRSWKKLEEQQIMLEEGNDKRPEWSEEEEDEEEEDGVSREIQGTVRNFAFLVLEIVR